MATSTHIAAAGQMQDVLNALAAFNAPPIPDVTPEVARQLPTPADAAMNVLGHQMAKRLMTPFAMPVGKIEHRLIPGEGGDILLRIYTPDGDGPFPVLVYFHGGGWVIATLDTYDASCRSLCTMAECIVVSVAYRQAPEHKFPAAVEDAWSAYQWALKNAAEIGGDPARVAVGGESAGGNLATVTAIMARDQGATLPVYQLLVYPVTNYAFDSASYHENADARPLDKASMEWFWKHYLPEPSAGEHPHASPLRTPDLSGLPPATVITAQLDPLCSEGRRYADRLRESGVPVEYRHYNGVTHEFFGMAAVVPEAREAVKAAAGDLKEAFGVVGRKS